MPPMPRQRRTECVPAGRRPRGTSTMADEAAPRGKLTFNIQANPLQAKPLCIRLRIKVWTIGKKEFRQEKFHVFFIYISISIVKVWKFWKMSGSIVRRTKTYEIRNNLNCLFNNLFKKKMKLRKKRGNVSTSKFLIQSQLGERLQDKTERRRTFNRRKRTSKRNKRKRRGQVSLLGDTAEIFPSAFLDVFQAFVKHGVTMSSRSIRFDRSLHVRISLQSSSSDPRCRSIAILRAPKTNRDSYPSCVYDLYSVSTYHSVQYGNVINLRIYLLILS